LAALVISIPLCHFDPCFVISTEGRNLKEQDLSGLVAVRDDKRFIADKNIKIK
jgi:hypothetical protein